MAGSPEAHSVRVCNSIQNCPVQFQNEKAFFPFDKQCALELGVRGLAVFLRVSVWPLQGRLERRGAQSGRLGAGTAARHSRGKGDKSR